MNVKNVDRRHRWFKIKELRLFFLELLIYVLSKQTAIN